MASALRVMTFNVQQLPWLGRFLGNAPVTGSPGGGGPTDPDQESRAHAVANAILALKKRDQPDVIGFNEVFSEDGRYWLLKLLKGRYPYFVKILEDPGLDVEEDSGLMLVSKLPFLALPDGHTYFYKPFPRGAGSDAMAAKGFGVVQVKATYNPTAIVFTHLQASYDADNTENADIRADQLSFLQQELKGLLGTGSSSYVDTVLMGDLNIKGDPDDKSGEWDTVFAGSPTSLGGEFMDQWRAGMHPPNDPKDYDPGYTQRDTPTYVLNRFDYHLAKRNANADVGLVAHHVKVLPFDLASEITDHWPLFAHYHRSSAHCTPATAVELLKLPPANGTGVPGSKVWKLSTDFAEEDMYHWVYIGDNGTYSIWTDPDLEVHAFRRSNLSDELAPIDTMSTAQLSGTVQAIVNRDSHINDSGQTFAWREPFYLRLRGRLTNILGKHSYAIVRHGGESAATAITLYPHVAVDPGLPIGQKLGADDQCWFRADRPDKFGEDDYTDTFAVSNIDQMQLDVQLLDTGQQVIPSGASGNGAELTATRMAGAEQIYLVLKRATFNSNNVLVTWRSALTFVALDESLRLHIDDETGPDWPGADELELDVGVDDESAYHDTWDDADSGEDWPGLVQTIRSNASVKQGQNKWIAFTESITFVVLKTDGIFAHGSSVGIIGPLTQYDSDIETRIAKITISDPAGDGHLTGFAKLSRYALK